MKVHVVLPIRINLRRIKTSFIEHDYNDVPWRDSERGKLGVNMCNSWEIVLLKDVNMYCQLFLCCGHLNRFSVSVRLKQERRKRKSLKIQWPDLSTEVWHRKRSVLPGFSMMHSIRRLLCRWPIVLPIHNKANIDIYFFEEGQFCYEIYL